MKKIFFLLLVLPLFLNGCSEDENPASKLYGVWTAQNYTITSVETNYEKIDEFLREAVQQALPTEKKTTITFTSAGSFQWGNQTGIFYYRNNTITFDFKSSASEVYDVNMSGNTLKLRNINITFYAKELVESISNSTLREWGIERGNIVITKVVGDYNLTKTQSF